MGEEIRDFKLPHPLSRMDWIRPFGLIFLAVLGVGLVMYFISHMLIGIYIRELLLILLAAYSVCFWMSGIRGDYYLDLLSKYGIYTVAHNHRIEKKKPGSEAKQKDPLPLDFWNDMAFGVWCAFMGLVLSYTDGSKVFYTDMDIYLWEATIVILAIKFFPLLFVRRYFPELIELPKAPRMRLSKRLGNALFGFILSAYCANFIVHHEWNNIRHILH